MPSCSRALSLVSTVRTIARRWNIVQVVRSVQSCGERTASQLTTDGDRDCIKSICKEKKATIETEPIGARDAIRQIFVYENSTIKLTSGPLQTNLDTDCHRLPRANGEYVKIKPKKKERDMMLTLNAQSRI